MEINVKIIKQYERFLKQEEKASETINKYITEINYPIACYGVETKSLTSFCCME